MIEPSESIKKGYGILKVKKPGMPVRPIISSIFSITSGAEKFILKIVSPLLKKCTFSLKSTKQFTEKFVVVAPKFTSFYEVCTFDAKSLFTSINVPRVVDHIIEQIYNDPSLYFEENNLGTVIPQDILQNFILDVLLKFNSFEAHHGYFRQRFGLIMGGKLSCALSNIFLNIMETEIISKFQQEKIILFYGRYVDDILLIVRKRTKNKILAKMNEFDNFLTFTVDEMSENSLKFLDTKVVISDNKLELKQYFKHENVVLNYKHAVAPTQYKNSCLIGEIYRAKNSTSNDDNLEVAFINLKNTFIKNSYPEKLIDSKINEIKNREFRPNPNKAIREENRNNPDLKFYSLSLPFTSFRCSFSN